MGKGDLLSSFSKLVKRALIFGENALIVVFLRNPKSRNFFPEEAFLSFAVDEIFITVP